MRGTSYLGVVILLYCLCDVIGQTGTRSQIQMSYSIQTNQPDDSSQNSTDTNNTMVNSGRSVHASTGSWRPRPRSRGQQQQQRRPYRIGRRLENGRVRPYIRRRPGSNGVVTHVQHQPRVASNSNVRSRADGTSGRRRLVATGAHTVQNSGRQNRTRQTGAMDPFSALERGSRNVFRDRQSAYDFLSNGGNSFRVRSENRRERREENAQMAAVMCGVFGKQFVPSAIGGRCVDPS